VDEELARMRFVPEFREERVSVKPPCEALQ
jgi:hypothetical protein